MILKNRPPMKIFSERRRTGLSAENLHQIRNDRSGLSKLDGIEKSEVSKLANRPASLGWTENGRSKLLFTTEKLRCNSKNLQQFCCRQAGQSISNFPVLRLTVPKSVFPF